MAPRSTTQAPTIEHVREISADFTASCPRHLVELAADASRVLGKFGTKTYWDDMYAGTGAAAADGLPADEYSWYCGFAELAPFFAESCPTARRASSCPASATTRPSPRCTTRAGRASPPSTTRPARSSG